MAAARPKARPPKAKRPPVLPRWMRDEDMLRRILALRRDGGTIWGIAQACGFSRNLWDSVRRVARHGAHPGDRMVAEAFLARFDALGPPRRGYAPMFTTEEGKLLAKDIARWKLPETVDA